MKIIKEALSYGLIGIINTLIGLSIIYSLMFFFDWEYTHANILGYCITLNVSFLLNRRFTFKVMDKPGQRMLLFFMVFLIAYAIQFAALRISKEVLGINPYICQLIGIVFYTSTGFLLNKFIAFGGKSKEYGN